MVLLFCFSYFVFTRRTSDRMGVFVYLIIRLSKAIGRGEINKAIRLVAVREDSRHFLLVIRFHFFSGMSVLFFRFFRSEDRHFFGLFVMAIIRFACLFRYIHDSFLFFLCVLIIVLCGPIWNDSASTRRLIGVIQVSTGGDRPFRWEGFQTNDFRWSALIRVRPASIALGVETLLSYFT